MKDILYIGSNFGNHDSSVFAIFRGQVFGISEERFTRYKHDTLWPIESLQAIKKQLAIDSSEIQKIVFGLTLKIQESTLTGDYYVYEKKKRALLGGRYVKDYHHNKETFLKKSRLQKLLAVIKSSEVGLMDLLGFHFRKKGLSFYIDKYCHKIFGNVPVEVTFFDHHDCHAYSTYFTSDFDEALVLTMDGWGDGAFTKVYRASAGKMDCVSQSKSIPVESVCIPASVPAHILETGIFGDMSVGHLYSIMTYLIDFMPVADEGKLEALAAYGRVDSELLRRLEALCIVEDCEVKLNSQAYLDFIFSDKQHDYIRSLDKTSVAATTQKYLENVYLQLVDNATQLYPNKNICLSGGVAANVILNMKIFTDRGFNIHISPAMADDGTAMGAAVQLFLQENPKDTLAWLKKLTMPYYGTSYSKEETELVLKKEGGNFPIKSVYVGERWPETCAKLVCDGAIGALFHGRAEFGPRALGNRSIVADLRRKENTDKINKLVKNRPGFQPFCPSFLLEEKEILFDKSYDNRHMTCAFRMKETYWETLPCAIHIDGTSRVQFVDKQDNPSYFAFLQSVKAISGIGGVLNTSFNKHGRTICESPLDALVDFVDCQIDFLMLNGYLVTRTT